MICAIINISVAQYSSQARYVWRRG